MTFSVRSRFSRGEGNKKPALHGHKKRREPTLPVQKAFTVGVISPAQSGYGELHRREHYSH
jgi:hypothetical protein